MPLRPYAKALRPYAKASWPHRENAGLLTFPQFFNASSSTKLNGAQHSNKSIFQGKRVFPESSELSEAGEHDYRSLQLPSLLQFCESEQYLPCCPLAYAH